MNKSGATRLCQPQASSEKSAARRIPQGESSVGCSDFHLTCTPPARGLLPLPHVQFWQAKNRRRLDRSHCGSYRRHISCLVDASDVRTVNILTTPPAWSMSALASYRRLHLDPGNKFQIFVVFE